MVTVGFAEVDDTGRPDRAAEGNQSIAAQHQARRLYSEYEREQARAQALEVEWGQLQLEQSTWATHGRVEKLAREKLGMRLPPAGQVLVVEPQS